MKYIIYIFPLMMIIFAGCERDLEVPFPPHDPKLVVNAYLHAGEEFDVYVTRSYGPLEKIEVADILIPDATVEVYEGNDLLANLVYRDTIVVDSFNNIKPHTLGKYHSSTSLIVEAGKSYTIKVSHSKYGTVNASTTIPLVPVVTKAEVIQDIYVFQYSGFDGEIYGSGQSRIDVNIDDPMGANYYDLEAAIIFFDSAFSNDLVFEELDTRSNPYFDPEGGYYGDDLPTPDTDFDGQNGVVGLLTWLPEMQVPIKDRKPLDIRTIFIEATSVSESYYQFKRKFELQWENRGGGDLGIVPSEAIIIYSNVENGYGVVAGFNTKVFEFEI